MTIAPRNAFGLEDKTCVVTGAGGGIGRGIVEALARDGARIAVLDRNLAGAEETARIAQGLGAEALAFEVDTSSEASVTEAQRAVAAVLGDAEVLVNNAGIVGKGGDILDLTLDDWNGLLSVNLTGYFLCARAFGKPMMARKNGAMVHVVSITALAPMAHGGNYGVAKAGASMLSTLLAAELAPHGVRSNAVHPGLVQTPMTQKSYDVAAIAEARARSVPHGRVAQPEDIAHAALFLASPLAGYVNGAEILVDGALRADLMSFIPSVRRPGGGKG